MVGDPPGGYGIRLAAFLGNAKKTLERFYADFAAFRFATTNRFKRLLACVWL
jgi:hypothetical protein